MLIFELYKKNEKNLSKNDIFLLNSYRKETFRLKTTRVPNIIRIFARRKTYNELIDALQHE